MAAHNNRTTAEVRRELESERERLAQAVDSLRAEVKDATNIGAKLRANLPLVAAGALGTGFLIAGGIGATTRLVFRRGREGKEKARVGPFSFVRRD
jgi:hypothetical protein